MVPPFSIEAHSSINLVFHAKYSTIEKQWSPSRYWTSINSRYYRIGSWIHTELSLNATNQKRVNMMLFLDHTLTLFGVRSITRLIPVDFGT